MTERALRGLTLPPSTRKDVKRVIRDLARRHVRSTGEIDGADALIEQAFPGGFDQRDEANALIAMSVRNGPIENLHAGASSPLLEDDSLSRLTDAEIKAIMVHATRTLAMMLWLRDQVPEVYRRHLQRYGSVYCRTWERWS